MNNISFTEYEVTYHLHKSIKRFISLPDFVSKSVKVDELVEHALRSKQISFIDLFNENDTVTNDYITSRISIIFRNEVDEEDMTIISEFDFDGSPKNIRIASIKELKTKELPDEPQNNKNETDDDE